MRIVLFCGWPAKRVRRWYDALRETRVVTDLRLVIVDGQQARNGAAPPPPDAAPPPDSIADVRAWRPDVGIALGVPALPPAMHLIPLRGTLGVRIGQAPEASQRDPGFWELWHGARAVDVTVHWLGLDRVGVGATASAPVYPHDSLSRVATRAEELGRELLSRVLERVAAGETIGSVRVQPRPVDRPPTPMRRLRLWARLGWRRARERLHPRMLAKYAVTAGWLAVVRPLRDLSRRLRRRHPVRVFTLHRVSLLVRDGMTIAPATFRRQVEYVRRHHDVVDLEQAVALIQSGARLSRPVAAITFDDGYTSVYRTARPIMASLGVTGTCFVCPGVVDGNGTYEHDADSPARDWLRVMDWDAIAALRDSGWTIGSHGVTHTRLSTLGGDALVRELRDSRVALRARLGESRMAFAYPFGGKRDISDEGVEVARWCGYTALFSDFGGDNEPGAGDQFTLRRTDIGGDHETIMWMAMVHGLDLRRWRPFSAQELPATI